MLLHIYHLLMCRSTRWYRNQLRKRERRFLQPKVKPNCNSDHSPFPHFPTVQQWGKCEKIGNSSWASTLNFNISFVNSTYYFGASIMNDNQKYNGDFDLQIVCTNVNNITLFKQEFVTDFSGNDRGYLWIAVGH